MIQARQRRNLLSAFAFFSLSACAGPRTRQPASQDAPAATSTREADRTQGAIAAAATPTAFETPAPTAGGRMVEQVVALPAPRPQGTLSLEEALVKRRSLRAFAETDLTLAELGQLLWAAQGITHEAGLRTAPSAGALYPLEIYAVTREATYRYRPQGRQLIAHRHGDLRPALHAAGLLQDSILTAPAVFVIAAVYARTERKYGAERTPRYVHLEAGHAAQGLLLQAVALGLGGVPIGAFYDDQVQRALALPADHAPLYLIPVGRPR
jgi:SagB-type dehydrogenase family enzyme